MESDQNDDPEYVDLHERELVDGLIDRFKLEISRNSADADIVQEFVLHGGSHALDDSQSFAIKKKISDKWDVHPSSIFIVGSAKLGFSIAPQKRYRHFGDQSDVDVAIVDHGLYQKFWHDLHDHKESGTFWKRVEDFEKYAAWGWIRPDMLPSSKLHPLREEWWEFFQTMKRDRLAGPLKIAAAVYHDISFLERYQKRSVMSCRQSMELGG